MEAFAWGDNAEGCLGLARGTSAALLPRELELHGLLPSERVVSLACSERYSGDSDGTASFASGVGGVSGLCSSIFYFCLDYPKMLYICACVFLLGLH